MYKKEKRAWKLLPISELLGGVITSWGLEARFNEDMVRKALKQCLSADWAKRVRFVSYKKGRVILSCDSPSLRQEIWLRRERIISSLNEALGAELVRELKIISGKGV